MVESVRRRKIGRQNDSRQGVIYIGEEQTVSFDIRKPSARRYQRTERGAIR